MWDKRQDAASACTPIDQGIEEQGRHRSAEERAMDWRDLEDGAAHTARTDRLRYARAGARRETVYRIPGQGRLIGRASCRERV